MKKYLLIAGIIASIGLSGCEMGRPCGPFHFEFENVAQAASGNSNCEVTLTRDGEVFGTSRYQREVYNYSEATAFSVYKYVDTPSGEMKREILFSMEGIEFSGNIGDGIMNYEGEAKIIYLDKEYEGIQTKVTGTVLDPVKTRCSPPEPMWHKIDALITFTLPATEDENGDVSAPVNIELAVKDI